jgi:CDP-diacylglycerol--glycerol-3-phosphate 3-phosphatidyltransferase
LSKDYNEEVPVSPQSIPNLLGFFRIIATPLLVVFILADNPVGYWAAAILLLLMAISDIVDGKLARKLQVVSPLGIFLDTTSDKIFVAGALIPMVERGLIPGWVALIIILRDFIISGLRSFAAAEGHIIAAREWGKQKLTITVTALVWCLIDAGVNGAAAPLFGITTDTLPLPIMLFARLASLWPVPMALALIWTVGSGAEYIWQAWPLLMHDTPKKPAEPPPQKSSVK